MTYTTDTSSDLSTNKPIPKGAYTILEMFIVIIIVGLLFLIVQDLFVSTNKVFVESSTCVQKMYGEIQKHINNAISGKGIATNGQNSDLIFPDNFSISVMPANQTITLMYGENTTGSIISPTDNNMISVCKNNDRTMTISGSTLEINIEKHLQSNFNKPAITIKENNVLSSKMIVTIPIYLCRHKSSGTECHRFHETIISKGAQTIRQNKCLVFHETCEKREENIHNN